MTSSSLDGHIPDLYPLIIDIDGGHCEVWDPDASEICIVTGRLFYEMESPHQRLLSVSLVFEYLVPAPGRSEAAKVRLLEARLGQDYQKVKVSLPTTTDADKVNSSPKWTLEVEYWKLEDLERLYATPEASKCHILKFRLGVPVGVHFFEDKGSGNVTRLFALRARCAVQDASSFQSVESAPEQISISVLKSDSLMEGQRH